MSLYPFSDSREVFLLIIQTYKESDAYTIYKLQNYLPLLLISTKGSRFSLLIYSIRRKVKITFVYKKINFISQLDVFVYKFRKRCSFYFSLYKRINK